MKKKLFAAIFACLASAVFVVGVFGSPIFNGINFMNYTDSAPASEPEPFSPEKPAPEPFFPERKTWEDPDQSPPRGH